MDSLGVLYRCTVSGTPGTWLLVGSSISPHYDHGFDISSVARDAQSTIAFDPATGTFTITPVSGTFRIWKDGTAYDLGTKTVVIPNTAGTPTVPGLYYISFDANNDLQAVTGAWSLYTGSPVATIYYLSSTLYAIDDERHNATRNRAWHLWAHATVGTRYESGLVGTFTNTTMSLTAGIIHDEDIRFDTAGTITNCRLWRYDGTRMVFTNVTTPYLASGVTLQYDLNGVATNVSNNNYVINDVYATPDPLRPIYVRVGTAQYTTSANAIAALGTTSAWPGLALAELKLLYQVIYRNQSGTITFIQSRDYRTSASIPGGGTLAYVGGSGTLNALAKWASGSTLGDSGISDDGTTISTTRTVALSSVAGTAPLNLDESAADPTTPADGDVWHTGDGILCHHTGVTRQIDMDADPGCIGTPALTIAVDGTTIDVAAYQAILFSATAWMGGTRLYNLAAVLAQPLVDQSSNYVVANYNSGTPVTQVIQNPALIDSSAVILVAALYRDGTRVHAIPVNWGVAPAARLINKSVQVERFIRSSGLVLTTSGLNFTVGSGVLWYGCKNFTLAPAVSTDLTNNVEAWVHDAGGNWVKTDVAVFNNTQYDTPTGPATLSSNTRYAVNWVYRYVDGAGIPKLGIVLGTGNYTQAQALTSTSPTPPTVLQRQAILVGRIIVARNDVTAYQVDSAFTTVFAGSTVTDHNNLANLQGGTADEYYHLTSAQATQVVRRMITLRGQVMTSVVSGAQSVNVASPVIGTIVGWRIITDVATTASLDVWKLNGANPTVLNTIVAAAPPTISAATYAASTTLTDWTTAVAVGDVFELNVGSNSAAKVITLQLDIAVG
jgi:hypothetical protein